MWTVGSTSSYRFRLFGVIPFGTHTIHIVRFDQSGVSSREETSMSRCGITILRWSRLIQITRGTPTAWRYKPAGRQCLSGYGRMHSMPTGKGNGSIFFKKARGRSTGHEHISLFDETPAESHEDQRIL